VRPRLTRFSDGKEAMTSEKVKTLGHAILVLLGAIGVVAALSLAGCG